MSRSICYHLSASATGTTAGAATIQVVRPARAYGVMFTCEGTGGGANGRHSYSLELNNAAQANGDTNNPPRETFLAGHVTTFISASRASGVASGNSGWIPIDVPLKPGDVLSLNLVQTGTAPASANPMCNVYCRET